METIKTIVPEIFSDLTIDDLLKSWLVPRKERYLLRMEKRLFVNDKLLDFSKKVFTGDEVKIHFIETEVRQISQTSGNASLAEVLYEDENLIIVNKVCGMKTHANKPDEIELQNHVSAYCKRPVFVVHRLDRETSGAVLFAKNSFVLPVLGTLLEQRKIHRTYLALVDGQLNLASFSINKRIGRDRHDQSKRCISVKGQEAVTHLKLIENFSESALVECLLETGRTHQIRVHLADAGFPIIGDPLYNHKFRKTASRMMLHASKMSLNLPFTFDKLEILAESDSFSAGLPREK